MAKYHPLRRYLESRSADQVRLSFQEIEQIIRAGLPASAHKYREWWANDRTHSQALAWMEVGWKVESVSVSARWVAFVRPEGDSDQRTEPGRSSGLKARQARPSASAEHRIGDHRPRADRAELVHREGGSEPPSPAADERPVAPSEREARINEGREVVRAILSTPKYSFRDLTPSRLPDSPGLYVITAESGEVLRAGRTDKQSLSDRVYRNHLMGSQQANLRAQLVKNGDCADLEEAKQWVREHCVVQVLEQRVLETIGTEMRWAEHFLLAVVRPRFSN
ncbi:unnamed protein product [marine sediment metagenome]|uniref:DUF7662 domain-containing protein n=1 Tax=marine sediment metagenome TaxID=412755 RepID=X1H5T4_9ZZZZ